MRRVLLFVTVLTAFSFDSVLANDRKDCGGLNSEKAVAACSRIIGSGGGGYGLSKAYGNRAIAFFEKGDFDRALADYNKAIELNPLDASAFHNRGLVHHEKRQFESALRDFDRSLSFPAGANVSLKADRYNSRGLTWREIGDYERAIADFNQALQLSPRTAFYFANRGEIWRLKGDLDMALKDQNRAVQIDPKSVTSLTLRGDTLRYRGDFSAALADYARAERLSPGTIPAIVGKGIVYERMGNLAKAKLEFLRAATSPGVGSEWGIERSAKETARARVASLESGEAPPSIPAAPMKAVNATSVPTFAVAAPVAANSLSPERVKPGADKQGRRVALVIGNSAYKNVSALANPQKDAAVIAASLRNIGFETVALASDASREKLIEALRAFAEEAEKADWAIVYYAGHGIEVNGVNYLIPVDAALKVDRDVQFETVPLDQVMASVEGAKKLRIVMLDACRDNPFTPAMRRTAAPAAVAAAPTAGGAIATRSVGRGLGEVKVSGASLVVYAAKHGQTALDGEGENSPFAIALVQRLATPGVEINKIFRLVRDDVMEATAGRQEPFTYGSLPGREDFFFVASR